MLHVFVGSWMGKRRTEKEIVEKALAPLNLNFLDQDKIILLGKAKVIMQKGSASKVYHLTFHQTYKREE